MPSIPPHAILDDGAKISIDVIPQDDLINVSSLQNSVSHLLLSLRSNSFTVPVNTNQY